MTLPTTAPVPGIRRAAPDPGPGLIGQGVLRLLTHRAAVSAVHVLSPSLRLISLRSEGFRRLAGAPGDKMQVRVAGMTFRTFTPVRLGDGDDELHLVGHEHGWGPGSDWVGSVAAGDTCHVMAPRRSLALGAIQRSTVFFGDETSVGLARALCGTALGAIDTHFIFETGDAAGLRAALEALGGGMLRNAWLVDRRPGDEHLADVEAALARYAGADEYRQYVFSGRAPAIQRLTRSLKAAGAKPSQMLVKAYWAPGKVGLD